MNQLLKQKMMKLSTTVTTRLSSGGSQFFRQLSTAATVAAAERMPVTKNELFNMLYGLGPTGGKVSDVLRSAMRSGKRTPKHVLIDCLKDLRKYGRYQHCLEILEWLGKGKQTYTSRDYALRLDLICRLKGIDEAEKYFDSIPLDAKNQNIYGALLNCYCTELATDKALTLFKKMDEMSCASNVLAFNNLMCMYVKVGQPEKVPALVDEMKQRNIPLSSYTYSFWIQSYRFLKDLEGVERVTHEVEEQDSVKDEWVIYSNLASVYIEVGHSEKAITTLEKLEDVLDNSNNTNRDAYHYLISLYACTGKLESVTRVWDKLKSKFRATNNTSYLNMLRALSKLDDMDGLKKYFVEWDSSYRTYDDRVPAVVIGAYLRHDMLEEAELLLKDVTKKATRISSPCHVKFMNYYFEKRQTYSALKHMAVAITLKWKLVAETLDRLFQLFKEEKDVDGAEEFCRLIKKAQPLDARAYLWLLQTYAAAEKTAPDMRHRIEEDGIDITPEHEELLDRVCPN